MSISTILKSQFTAWLLGGVLLAGASVFAYWLVGWIGIGTIGVFALLISMNVSLHSGHAVAGGELASADASMYARQLEEERRSLSTPEQRIAAEAERGKRSRVLYLINSIFIAMTALGFWMFVQHDL